MFYLLAFLIIICLFIILVTTIRKINRLSYFEKLKESNKKKYITVRAIIIALMCASLGIDYINTIVVLTHFVLISLLVDLICLFLKKVTYDNKVLITLILTIIYMSYGLFSAYDVRKTAYNLSTDKEINDVRIAQITDAHLGTTFNGDGFKNYVLEIANQNPDMLVITGDLVDDSSKKEDLVKALSVFKNINLKYGVYFVFGNHDKGYGNSRDFTESELREELEKNNVRILEDMTVELGDDIILVGRQDKSVSNRKKASELINDLDKNKYIIVLDHQPNDYDALKETNADLVISGHTHGGQLIPLGLVGLMIKSNDKVYGLEKINNTNFIVSSGISSWAVKFKTGTFSEYVIIDVKKSH